MEAFEAPAEVRYTGQADLTSQSKLQRQNPSAVTANVDV
jgi:hypothetical protein